MPELVSSVAFDARFGNNHTYNVRLDENQEQHQFKLESCTIQEIHTKGLWSSRSIRDFEVDMPLVALQENIRLRNRIQNLEEKLFQMEERIKEIYYAPGMPGYKETEKSFNQLSNDIL